MVQYAFRCELLVTKAIIALGVCGISTGDRFSVTYYPNATDLRTNVGGAALRSGGRELGEATAQAPCPRASDRDYP